MSRVCRKRILGRRHFRRPTTNVRTFRFWTFSFDLRSYIVSYERVIRGARTGPVSDEPFSSRYRNRYRPYVNGTSCATRSSHVNVFTPELFSIDRLFFPRPPPLPVSIFIARTEHFRTNSFPPDLYGYYSLHRCPPRKTVVVPGRLVAFRVLNLRAIRRRRFSRARNRRLYHETRPRPIDRRTHHAVPNTAANINNKRRRYLPDSELKRWISDDGNRYGTTGPKRYRENGYGRRTNTTEKKTRKTE